MDGGGERVFSPKCSQPVPAGASPRQADYVPFQIGQSAPRHRGVGLDDVTACPSLDPRCTSLCSSSPASPIAGPSGRIADVDKTRETFLTGTARYLYLATEQCDYRLTQHAFNLGRLVGELRRGKAQQLFDRLLYARNVARRGKLHRCRGQQWRSIKLTDCQYMHGRRSDLCLVSYKRLRTCLEMATPVATMKAAAKPNMHTAIYLDKFMTCNRRAKLCGLNVRPGSCRGREISKYIQRFHRSHKQRCVICCWYSRR